MHQDLKRCIETAFATRDLLLARKISVKEANAVAAQHHSVISSYAVDLRMRIFAPDKPGVRMVERLASEIESPGRSQTETPTDDAG